MWFLLLATLGEVFFLKDQRAVLKLAFFHLWPLPCLCNNQCNAQVANTHFFHLPSFPFYTLFQPLIFQVVTHPHLPEPCFSLFIPAICCLSEPDPFHPGSLGHWEVICPTPYRAGLVQLTHILFLAVRPRPHAGHDFCTPVPIPLPPPPPNMCLWLGAGLRSQEA